MRALAVALLIGMLGAASDNPQPSSTPAALLCASTAAPRDEIMSGTMNVFVAGTDRALCDIRMREHHSMNAVVAGSDGTLYVAESALVYIENATDTGAVDVFAPDGRLVRRITDGIANPSALALDALNRLYVANTGRVWERGVELRVAPHVSVYEPHSSSPSKTYPLPASIDARRMLLAPDGDLIVGDLEQGVVGRFRPGVVTPRQLYRAPHGSLVVQHPNSTTIFTLDQRALRLNGDDALVALYGGGGGNAFFVEWSLDDGRVLRRVEVPLATDLVVDGANRLIVSQNYGIALVFPPHATKPTARFTTMHSVWGAAIDARDRVVFAGRNDVVALDGAGRRVASYRFAPHTDLALVDAPRGSAPPSDETPAPSLATPPPPAAAEIAANVRGSIGVAYDRISAFGLRTAPPLELPWTNALRLPAGSLRGTSIPVQLVHVAILGPYARIANRDESIVEIVDCVHRTVTSLSPARKLARMDVAVPDFAPRPTAVPQARALLATTYRPSLAVRANGTTAIDGRRAERYDVTVTFGYGKDAPAAFRAEKSPPFGAHASLALAAGELPAPACPDLNIGPRGRIPGISDAAARPISTREVRSLAQIGLDVAREGPPLPQRFVLAESGRTAEFGNFYARAGNIRALGVADAALFAVPAGVRFDRQAPVIVERW